MSEIIRALGLEESYEFEGTAYKLAPLTFEVIGLWEGWLKQRADRDLVQSRRWLSDAEYLLRVDRLAAAKAAGDYDFFGPVSCAAQQGWEGKIELAAVRLAEAPGNKLDPEAARRLARKIQETNLEKWVELQKKMEAMDDDPNSPAPPPAGPAASASSPSAPASPGSPGTCAPGKSAS